MLGDEGEVKSLSAPECIACRCLHGCENSEVEIWT